MNSAKALAKLLLCIAIAVKFREIKNPRLMRIELSLMEKCGIYGLFEGATDCLLTLKFEMSVIINFKLYNVPYTVSVTLWGLFSIPSLSGQVI